MKLNPCAVEEDGDEVFTPIPKRCHCGGRVRLVTVMGTRLKMRKYECDRCGGSYGIRAWNRRAKK